MNTQPDEQSPYPKRGKALKPYSVKELTEILPDWRVFKATAKQARFAICYLEQALDPGKAYLTAVDPKASRKKAVSMGHSMLRETPVQACLQAYTADFIQTKKEAIEREVLGTCFARAFYDPSRFITPQGEVAFQDWETLDPMERRVVDSIVSKPKYHNGVECGVETVIKLAPREASMAMLAQYVSLFAGTQGPQSNLSPETASMLQSMWNQAKATTGSGNKAE